MQFIAEKISFMEQAARRRARKLAWNRRGSSEIVSVVGLIVVVVVILTVVFFPQIKSWFASVMTSLGTSTTNLFNLT